MPFPILPDPCFSETHDSDYETFIFPLNIFKNVKLKISEIHAQGCNSPNSTPRKYKNYFHKSFLRFYHTTKLQPIERNLNKMNRTQEVI